MCYAVHPKNKCREKEKHESSYHTSNNPDPKWIISNLQAKYFLNKISPEHSIALEAPIMTQEITNTIKSL